MISSESQPTNWKNKIVSHIAQQQIDRCIFCGSNFNNIFHAQNSFHNTIVNVISLNHGSGAFPYNNTSASSSRGCERILSAECEKMSKPHTKHNRWFATCFNWNRRFLSSPLLVVVLRHNRLSKSGICRAYANKAFRNIGHFFLLSRSPALTLTSSNQPFFHWKRQLIIYLWHFFDHSGAQRLLLTTFSSLYHNNAIT